MKVTPQNHPLGTIPMLNGHPVVIGAGLFPSASRRPQAKVVWIALNEEIQGQPVTGEVDYRLVMS